MHNTVIDALGAVGQAIADQFLGLKKLEIKCEIDKRCWDCNGRGSVREYSTVIPDDELEEIDLDFPDEKISSFKKIPPPSFKMIECSCCKGSGVISNVITLNTQVDKKAGEKKSEVK